MNIGKALTNLRKSKGLSRQNLADNLEISVHTYIKYENESVKPPYDTLCKLADFYGVTTDYLLGRETRDPQTPIVAFAKEANLKELEEVLITKYLELSDKQRESVMEFLRNAIAEETARKSAVQSNAQNQIKKTDTYNSKLAIARSSESNYKPAPTEEQYSSFEECPDDMID